MPEFIPQYTPSDLDDFTRAYLDAAEWLTHVGDDCVVLDEYEGECHGWHASAIERAVKDCKRFQTDNARLLAIYERRYGLGASQAGHDFWLTRNGHGAGFWDRGAGKVGDLLSDACDAYGTVDACLGDDGYLYFM